MLPDHLKQHLENLGAEIKPLSALETEVQVPGANRRWRFELSPDRYPGMTSQRYISLRAVDKPGERPKDWKIGVDQDHVQGWDAQRLLSHISDGHRTHDGPTHMLMVRQHIVPEEDSFRRAIRTHLITEPDTKKEQVYFTNDNRQYEQLGKAVLENQAPIEVLVDELANRHNVSHLVTSAPQQYAKAYNVAIKPNS